MKNIAVLVNELTTNYNFSVLEGIESFFKEKEDVRYFVATICQPAKKGNNYDYQYWTAVDILKSPEIDAVIVITNTFLTSMKLDELIKELEVFKGKPIFSVAVPLNMEKSFYTHTVCTQAYEEVVNHMVNVHGKKKIGFFSAGLIDSPDSEDRLEAFKAALEKNGIPFDPDLVLDGDFTPGTAKEVFLAKYKTKEEVPFDAILCANDYTAGGCMLAFMELGISYPEDIALFGFDDDLFALMTKPTLSSINQSIVGSGYKAAEMAWNYLQGNAVEKMAVIQSHPVYRQSCGCITNDLDTSAYIDQTGKYHPMDERVTQQTYNLLIDKLDQINAINSLVDVMNTRTPFKDFVEKTIGMTLYVTKITDIFICLYENPLHCDKYADFFLPDEAQLVLFANDKEGVRYSSLQDERIIFNPHERILPEKYDDTKAGKYYLQAITMHESNYGYICCRLEHTDDTVISVNLKILTNVIIQSLEYQHDLDQRNILISRNQTLNLQSKTDELTQILNRRGFYEHGQQLINLSVVTGKKGVVFFCDLDGLKTINDTYGHDIGDLAIKTEAQILKKLFRDSDMVGRLSGDEFGVVAPGMALENIPALRERLLSMNESSSKEAGLPFTLSISLGSIEFSEEKSDLAILLADADDKLYIEKHLKHPERDGQKGASQ